MFLSPSFGNHFVECEYLEVFFQSDESCHSDLVPLKYSKASLSNLMRYEVVFLVVWVDSLLSKQPCKCCDIWMLHNTFQVLTLASNERVPLTSSMRLVFEISHLRTATPATVSRAGILYVNQLDLGWNP